MGENSWVWPQFGQIRAKKPTPAGAPSNVSSMYRSERAIPSLLQAGQRRPTFLSSRMASMALYCLGSKESSYPC